MQLMRVLTSLHLHLFQRRIAQGRELHSVSLEKQKTTPTISKMMDTHHRRPPILRDPNTLSNYDKYMTRHITANFTINFVSKDLAGSVSLQLDSTSSNLDTRQLILDTSFLDVHKVDVNGDNARWELLPRHEAYGSALKIDFPEKVSDVRGPIHVQVQAESRL